jgi:GT2 family glycosyltransferase
MKPKVAIIIVNWNGWKDTILCLESILHNHYCNYQVLLCDNGSKDQSLKHIKEWAVGQKDTYLSHNGSSLCQKPVEYEEFTRNDIEVRQQSPAIDVPLVLIDNGTNLGFAGGNNVGIRYAMKNSRFQYVWLLNNDTVINAESICKLVESSTKKNDGTLLSSFIICKDSQDKVWFEGGVYNPWFATGSHVAYQKFVRGKYQYLTGCALFIPLRILDKLGLLDESIFLYAEDLDCSILANKAGIPLDVVKGSVVDHVGSASSRIRSPRAYRLYVRNIIRVIRRHHGEIYLLSIVPYHILKLLYLGLIVRIPFSCVSAYWDGLIKGIKDEKTRFNQE